MRLGEVELRRLRMPLRRPFRAAHGTEQVRDILLVRVSTEGGSGWGECCALSAPTYTSEYVEGAHAVIRDHLVPRLVAAPSLRAEDVARLLAPVKGHPMAKAALEMALLDSELRTAGVSLAARLGGVREGVEAGVVLGIADSVPALLDEAEDCVAAGYRRLKVKVQPGWDVAPLNALRERFGEGILLQADANGAYSLDDAPRLAELDGLRLTCLEQPLPEEQVRATADLARRLRTPICLDESITSLTAAVDAIDAGACSVICVKPGRVGGYLTAVRIHDLCLTRGIPVWCGGMLETGLGRAGNLALAALPGFTLPGDLAGSDRYYDPDLLTEPIRATGGTVPVPTAPGLGVDPDPGVLERVTWHTEHLHLS